MATIFRSPLKAPDFRAYRNAAIFAAAIVGATPPVPLTLMPFVAPDNPLGTAQENVGPAFKRVNAALIPVGPPNLQQTTLFAAPVARPFSQEDWPNPRGRLFHASLQDVGPPNLQLTKFFRTPIRPLAWPNPRGSPFPVGLQSRIDGLQQTTLAPVVARPFSQEDWPNPRGARFPAGLQAKIDGLQQTTLAPTVTNLGRAFETNGPHFIVRSGQTWWSQDLVRTTLATPVVQRPFAQTDWQNPRAAPPLNVGDVEGFTSSIRGVAHKPFLKTDWPVPLGAARANPDEVQGFPSPIRDYASGLNDANKRPFDWPVPRGPQRSIDALTWTQTLALAITTQGAGDPFNQTEWPVPIGLGPRQAESRGFEAPIRDYASGLNDANKRKYDWPNPILGLGPRQADTTGFPEPIRSHAVGLNDANKRPSDWPVPRGPKRSIDALTWTQSLALSITTQGTKPFVQSDWPLQVPRVYRQIADTVGFSTPVRNYAVGLNTANRPRFHWTVPPAAAERERRGFVFASRQILSVQRPFVQTDWPVPKGAKPNQRLAWYQSGALFLPVVAVQYEQAVDATITLTVEFHICGWGTETEAAEGFTPESEQADVWTVAAQEPEGESVETPEADGWSEQTQSDDDYDEKDECGR